MEYAMEKTGQSLCIYAIVQVGYADKDNAALQNIFHKKKRKTSGHC